MQISNVLTLPSHIAVAEPRVDAESTKNSRDMRFFPTTNDHGLLYEVGIVVMSAAKLFLVNSDAVRLEIVPEKRKSVIRLLLAPSDYDDLMTAQVHILSCLGLMVSAAGLKFRHDITLRIADSKGRSLDV